MLSKYADFSELKIEIETYLEMLSSFKELPCMKEIKSITKYILFLNQFTQNKENMHYKNFMIYDVLMLMHSLTQNSVRNFFNTYRSFIENFIRTMLELNDNDETGVRELFKRLRDFETNEKIKEIIDFIEGEYSKGCEFVHSNINADMPVFTYYSDIIKTDEMNERKVTQLVMKVLTLMKKITLFIIYIYSNRIEGIFYRRKQELRFLIGDKNYTIFEKELNIAS